MVQVFSGRTFASKSPPFLFVQCEDLAICGPKVFFCSFFLRVSGGTIQWFLEVLVRLPKVSPVPSQIHEKYCFSVLLMHFVLQCANQLPISSSANQHQPASQPANQPASKPANPPASCQPDSQTTSQPARQPTNQPASQPVSQPASGQWPASRPASLGSARVRWENMPGRSRWLNSAS